MVPVLLRTRGRVLTAAGAVAVALALLLWWMPPFGEPPPRTPLTMSTGVGTGVYAKYGTLLRKALGRDVPEVDLTLRPSEGSQENVRRVATGEADFTIATADAVEQYRAEGGPDADRLRSSARLYDDYIQVVVPEDSEIEEVADLRGKRVAVGQVASGVRLVAERVLRAAGLDAERDVDASPAGIGETPEALREGRIDAFFWSGGLTTEAVRNLSKEYEIRLLPLSSLIDRLHHGGGSASYYRTAVMPADAYPLAQRGTDVPTLAVANLLVTTDRMGDDLAEKITRTVIDSRDHIGARVHAAQLVDVRTAIYTDPLELHDGARRYFRSVKP
ncbi:TAXI family TRAP transporter solute-binding subunit [Streptomyces sp. SID8014]|uniref:TAXI family TRAP transporter solute-binding subunit n=1 Tax=Streptomyces sp. SID8014 TaxID=2706097 RepID=UPI0013B750E7|nr:TAXI family TRAP transporter solute-binding subunit [Streptomyces sp. SID8014]NEC16155.1 TAXI family TRAP transporter solute-binding subunit [Streptomyces sp. SID8014]